MSNTNLLGFPKMPLSGDFPVISNWSTTMFGSYGIQPAPGFGTTSGVKFSYRRVGNMLEFQGGWTNGTISTATAYLSLPAGLHIDFNALNTAVQRSKLGIWSRLTNTASDINSQGSEGHLYTNNSDDTKIYIAKQGSSGAYAVANVDDIFANSQVQIFTGIVPIREWNMS